jgi:PPP family 3-phenylpropionic acid transporter
MRSLASYLFLYTALYAGWGVLSPFLPAVLASRGATAEEIGVLLAAAIAVRLVAVPAVGLLVDRLGAPRQVLAILLVAGAALGLAYGSAAGLNALLLVSAVHAAATGPLGPLPDALAVSAAGSRESAGFSYGWVRGTGAAAFIAGSAIAGMAIARAGSPDAVLWLNAALLALAAAAALLIPAPVMRDNSPEEAGQLSGRRASSGAKLRALLGVPAFRWLLVAAGLISGSHALYAGFATLRWQAAGLAPEAIGLLWSISVGAEVVVFFLLGRPMLAWLGPAGLTALAAGAGALRWTVMGATAWLPAMFLVQPLHGLTFAAQHLAAMAVLSRVAPNQLAATAQTIYASLGTGVASAALTLVSGTLYERFGAQGFWLMALLCAAAIPAALMLQADLHPARLSNRPADRSTRQETAP